MLLVAFVLKYKFITMASTSPLWGCCTSENRKEGEQYVACKKCNLNFHFVCISIPVIPADSDEFCKWICSVCTNMSSNPTIINSTPVRNVSTTRGNKRPALNSPPVNKSVTSDDVREIVQDVIKRELAAMLQQLNNSIVSIVNKELEPIGKEVSELRVSLNFHTKQFEDSQSEQAALKKTVKDLKDENTHLKTSYSDLSQRLSYLEQQARANNLEIQCLPENKQENLYTVVKQLGSVVKCELRDSDILHCTRTAKLQTNSTRPRSVVVQLASPRIRDQLLAAVIVYNKNNKNDKLNSADFGIAGMKTPVYVVEHLSSSNKSLHAAARLKAQEKGYRYVWVRNGRIFVRKADGEGHILIKNLDSLNKII